ncbi:MAG: LacI family DNA-binding transcriptional regulator [Ancrocorticia sp.]|uniref:LacI family DNA-binding transcriptional regulator n=1 Tax=Ancrocorticia sp. TaxID=2593684 RepID=UPI003F8E02FF
MAKRVTLADIARSTGLSAATVSMALNGRQNSRIPESTAARVREAAEQLGYSPDVNARGLRTGRTQAIGFVSDEVTLTRYASAMIRGLLDESAKRNFVVMMAEGGTGSAEQRHGVGALLGRRIDGLIFGQMRSRQIQLPDLNIQVPVVIVNGTAPGHTSVLPDEHTAGRKAVEHLVSKGHTKIALIGRSREHLDPTVSVTIPARMRGIDEAMEAAGLAFVTEFEGADWEPELGRAGAQHIIDSEDVTAVIAANDRIAFGVLQEADSRGLSVPGDISIISFDDESLATYVRPQLSTVRLPYKEMGEAAMSMLLDSIVDAKPLDQETVYVPMPLVERGSVGEARG